MNKKDIELLQFVRQNAQMGTVTLSALSEMPIGEDVKKVLASQLAEYQAVFDAAGNKLTAAGEDTKNVGTVTQVAATAMLNMQSLLDKSDSHIAEMVMVGSARGIVSVTRRIRENPNGNIDCVNLAYRLLAVEERNFCELKRFL